MLLLVRWCSNWFWCRQKSRWIAFNLTFSVFRFCRLLRIRNLQTPWHSLVTWSLSYIYLTLLFTNFCSKDWTVNTQYVALHSVDSAVTLPTAHKPSKLRGYRGSQSHKLIVLYPNTKLSPTVLTRTISKEIIEQLSLQRFIISVHNLRKIWNYFYFIFICLSFPLIALFLPSCV